CARPRRSAGGRRRSSGRHRWRTRPPAPPSRRPPTAPSPAPARAREHHAVASLPKFSRSPAPALYAWPGRPMPTDRRSWSRRSAGVSESAPLAIGHRGASALCTETTLAAFRRAADDGADGVELDVLCCTTGEVVVFHDDDLARLAGRADRIKDLPLG